MSEHYDKRRKMWPTVVPVSELPPHLQEAFKKNQEETDADDARRYRWLKTQFTRWRGSIIGDGLTSHDVSFSSEHEDLDLAIDAEIAKQQPKEPAESA